MPRISLEPRKTTWVKFIEEAAKMKMERKCNIYYYKSNILSNITQYVDMKYKITGLKSGKCIPSSQLIIKENGIPVTITQTVVSLEPDKFSSATTNDPFVEITDNVASVEKSKIREKKLSKRVIERAWDETVTRVVKIENKTGKKISLDISVYENPAEDIVFVSSTPKPSRTTPPERAWTINMKKEEEKTITLKFTVKRTDSIRLPPDKTRGYVDVPDAAMPLSQLESEEEYLDELEEQEQQFKG
jgi:hypothetical protein